MKDDYSQYFVMKEATSNIQSFLSGVSHVNHLVVTFNSVSTYEEIASDISLEDYLDTTGATYDKFLIKRCISYLVFLANKKMMHIS